jgi:hypothetical protein
MTFTHEAILASTWDNVQLYGIQLLQMILVPCHSLSLSHTSFLFPHQNEYPMALAHTVQVNESQ